MKSKVSMVRNYLDLREAAKRAELAVDSQLDEIVRRMSIGETVDVDGDTFELVDTFQRANTQWRAARVHRLELKEVKA